MVSLYRRILGTQFEALPPALRRFHDLPDGGRAAGTLRVERPRGWLRHGLAACAGLPAAGSDIPVRLEVHVDADRERWVRHFPDRRLTTVQWANNQLLMERSGPITLACALVVDGPRLIYEFQRSWFLGIPMPRRLAPSVESWAEGDDRGWRVMVRLIAPPLGDLIRYEGWVEPK
jgi:hypothetical protein